MNKLIVKILFHKNQSKILHYHNLLSVSYHRFNIIKTTKMMYSSVTSGADFYFVKRSQDTSLFTIKRTLSCDITSIENDETVIPENDICDVEEATFSSNKLRSLLYSDSNDLIINQLKLCQTVQKVFDIVNENEQCFNHEHCSQAIVVLWDLQKLYEYANSADDTLNETRVQKSNSLDNYKRDLNQHPTFKNLLYLTSLTYKEMSPDALSCIFLYLQKMGVSFTNSLLQNLTIHLKYLLDTVEPLQFPLTAISRFSVGIFYNKNLSTSLTLVAVLPHIIASLNSVDNVKDFRPLTICLRTLTNLMDTKLLNKYTNVIEEFISKGLLTSEHTSVILKAILLLDQPTCSQDNIVTIRNTLLLLCGATSHLTEPQISLLQKALRHHLEPYPLIAELEASSGQTLAKCKIGNFFPDESYLTAVTSGKHLRGMYVARQIVDKEVSVQSLMEIYPFISTADIKTCNKYWMKLITFLQSPTAEISETLLYAVCLRYLNFSSNMSWYHNRSFEKQIILLLTKDLTEGVAGHIPSKFSQIASFLLAFDQLTARAMPKHIVSKSLEIMNQFSELDCQNISKGLSVAMDIRRRRGILTQEFLQQFVNLDAALNSRAMHFLQKDSFSIHILNKIMRAYIYRKGARDTELFHQLVKKYEAVQELDLSSRGLRDIVYNLVATRCLIPELFDKMVSYCVEQKDNIIGDTACKLVYACYYLGYTPAQGEEFFAVASRLILRDKERLTGLGLLQGSLALSFFNHLPSSLIKFIFTVDFLEYLDDEIKHCYAKATYPVRIRQTLMELNRAVCLDQPEAGVPWFHVKFCEEQHALGIQERYFNSSFLKEVRYIIVLATGSKDCVQTNVSSPYGYNIDLQVCLNQDQKPVDPRKEDASSLNKIAILLQSSDNFATNVRQLKGYNQMEQRHLEMMGYRVIYISNSLWNAMYMTEPKAKLNHVKKLIWSSSS